MLQFCCVRNCKAIFSTWDYHGVKSISGEMRKRRRGDPTNTGAVPKMLQQDQNICGEKENPTSAVYSCKCREFQICLPAISCFLGGNGER